MDLKDGGYEEEGVQNQFTREERGLNKQINTIAEATLQNKQS